MAEVEANAGLRVVEGPELDGPLIVVSVKGQNARTAETVVLSDGTGHYFPPVPDVHGATVIIETDENADDPSRRRYTFETLKHGKAVRRGYQTSVTVKLEDGSFHCVYASTLSSADLVDATVTISDGAVTPGNDEYEFVFPDGNFRMFAGHRLEKEPVTL